MSMPRITKGLGSFTARAFNRMALAVEKVERASPRRRSFRAGGKTLRAFPALITGAQTYASCFDEDQEDEKAQFEWNWIYSWSEMKPIHDNETGNFFGRMYMTPAGLSGTAACDKTNTGAFNLRELANDARAEGSPLDYPFMGPGIDMPRDKSMYPEQVNGENFVGLQRQYVLMWEYPISNPDISENEAEYWYFFDQDNPIKCEGDGEPFRASTLDISLDLGSLVTPELDHSNLDFGALT